MTETAHSHKTLRIGFDLEKLLRYAVKAAAVCFTAPATIAVAGQLYPDQLGYRLMAQAAGLVLVEGALLLGWHLLDTNKAATLGQRALYAVLASVGYGVLWVIALAHGEGAVGIAFRLTLGVLLGYSVFESGILAALRQGKAIDRSIQNDWQVRHHARKLEREYAKAELDAEYKFKAAYLDAETAGGLRVVENHKAQLENEAAMLAISGNGRKWQGWLAANAVRAEKKNVRKEMVAALVTERPELSHKEVSDSTGIPVSTVSRYRREIEAEQNGWH